MARRKKATPKTTMIVRKAPRRRAPARVAAPRTVTRTRTRTNTVVRKVADRAKIAAAAEKEGMTAIAMSAIIGAVEAKFGAKLPAIVKKIGLPATVGIIALAVDKLNLGGASAKKFARPMAMAGLAITAFKLGKNLANGKLSLEGDDDAEYVGAFLNDYED